MGIILKNGIYFVGGVKDVILSVGGKFDDFKERPIVTLLQSQDDSDIFWAVPIGDLSHRNEESRNRINKYLKYPFEDIRSCFYHIGKTNKESLFFLSDTFPITADYILREYRVFNSQHYVIKNKQLIYDLERKLKRILSYEQSKIKQTGDFFFRQNIFGLYDYIRKQSKPLEIEASDPEAKEELGEEVMV
ncbi:MAG: hypothetical protein FWG90_08985 [Oscillospiraceae bacterium]|nr:hypothetical protein [Oscillospiraceae bacterium]